MDKFPPLKSLRYFMVAAQYKSMSQAAIELNVTHSAISHQIKALEEWLDTPLFLRVGNNLELTEAGKQLLPDLQHVFYQIISAIQRIKPNSKPLIITTLPSFAARWLVPRLEHFRANHPDIDVHLSTTKRLLNISAGAADIAIRYGKGSWPGLQSTLIYQVELFPVCSPRLIERYGPISNAEDILNLPLLGDPDVTEYENTWYGWAKKAGVPNRKMDIVLHFDTSALMLQAALNGLGVGLSHNLLCDEDLREGRLVRLSEVTLKSDFDYYLVRRAGSDPRVDVFSQWVLEAIKSYS